MSGLPDPSTFLSGDSGDVTDPWRRLKRRAGELAYSALDVAGGTRRQAARLAARGPALDVLAIGVYRPGSLMGAAARELARSRHRVTVALGAVGAPERGLEELTVAGGLAGGKFENLNRVLSASEPQPSGWTVVVDDDVSLPSGFLDRLLGVCTAFGLDLAQPAQTLLSHSAWKVTRRRPASLVRETRFVEIGPVTAFGPAPARELLPFPELRYGWGLDLHWAALAAERGWRLGVIDAVPVRHETQPVAAGYPRDEAEREAAHFLAGRPYLPSTLAGETVALHRRAPG